MMNKALIADSSGIVSLVTETDRNHAQAEALANQYVESQGSILVPSDVFSETLNVLGKKAGHQTAIKTGQTILQSEAFVVVYPDERITDHAFTLFQTQPESVSFTDCLVMATADHYGIKNIFGFDEVFADNGYTIPEAA